MKASTQATCSVLGLGCAAVDDLLFAPSYPAADAKVRLTRHERRFGGLVGNALVAAARLGATCAYAGCLGDDDASKQVAANFEQEGIDVSQAPRLEAASVIRSVIVIGEDCGSRNIFYQADGMIGAHPTLPDEAMIRQARVLLIDHYGMAGNLRAVRIARAAGVAVVSDFEDERDPLFGEVLPLVDHLLLSEEAAQRITKAATPAEAAAALWASDRAAVVVTCGAAGCWSMSAGAASSPRHHPAFSVTAVDTNGCGDVFHGAYAAALARGLGFADRIQFASAAAALRASERGYPDSAAVDRLIHPYSASL